VSIAWTGFAIAVGTALVLRLLTVLWLHDTFPYSDYFYYHDAARAASIDWRLWFDPELIQRFAKLSWWPPGYPVFLGLIYDLFGVHHRVAVFVQVILGSATTAFVYLIALRVTSAWGEIAARRVALIAALLVACNPTFIFVTNLLASENLFAFWLCLGLWLALRPMVRRRDAILVGVALVLATYTRAIGIVVPFVIAWTWFRTWSDRTAWRRATLWMFAAFFALLLPWTVRNAVVVGSPALISHGGGINFYYGNNPDFIGFRQIEQTPMRGLTDPAEIDSRARQLAWQYIRREPGAAIVRDFGKLGRLFAPPRYAMQANNAIELPPGWEDDPELTRLVEEKRARQRPKSRLLRGPLTTIASVYSYVLLAGAILSLAMWKRLTPQARWFAWLAIAWVILHMIFWAQPRFRYPLELYMTVSTASVVGWFVLRPGQIRHRARPT
jgi:4-amino-4-deoxy-L-arabinose transferase-like glycosyltransferase